MQVPEEKSDKELLVLIQLDNRAAFSTLYDRYWLNLVKKALFRLGNQDYAEEVVQNVFVNIWTWRASIVIKGHFKGYIYRMLKNEMMRFISDRLKQDTLLQIEDVLDDIFISDEDHLHRIEYEELEKEIDLLVDGLPDKCKLIFRMSRDEGLTSKQIADNLNISKRTVETQLSKAVRKLKDAIHRMNVLFFL